MLLVLSADSGTADRTIKKRTCRKSILISTRQCVDPKITSRGEREITEKSYRAAYGIKPVDKAFLGGVAGGDTGDPAANSS